MTSKLSLNQVRADRSWPARWWRLDTVRKTQRVLNHTKHLLRQQTSRAVSRDSYLLDRPCRGQPFWPSSSRGYTMERQRVEPIAPGMMIVGIESVALQYYAEIDAIRSVLSLEFGHPMESNEMLAITIWQRIANPIRIKKETTIRIYPPEGIGEPARYDTLATSYLLEMLTKEQVMNADEALLQRRRQYFLMAALVVSVMVNINLAWLPHDLFLHPFRYMPTVMLSLIILSVITVTRMLWKAVWRIIER